ncbi:hypothetical protein [Nocardioides sp.]|uniref:hypothetical protein n=1 Tax=Nocardioides sp. TaxID=35761 RepID=UPI002ED023FA
MRSLTLPVGTALLAAALGCLTGSAYPDARLASLHKDVDLTATAHPGPTRLEVADVALDTLTIWRRASVKADTSATSSATCRGCAGTAAAVQVLYIHQARRTRADNAAIAWSQCRSCEARSVSVQVVVIRRPTRLTANNRALGTNVACLRCGSTAEAYQLVVIGADAKRLSPEALADLHAWATDRATGRANAADKQGRAQALPTASAALEQLVNRDLGTTTVLLDADASVPR